MTITAKASRSLRALGRICAALMLAAGVLFVAGSVAPADAARGWHGGGGWHGGWCCGGGWGAGLAPWWGWPYYYPGYYPYAYEPAAPVTVIQQPSAPAAAPAPSTAQTWYYCDSSKGYYPYVQTCNTGWRQVPAAPPR